MCRPHREQAHSHIGLHSSGQLGQLWERACSRWRSVRRRNLECAGLIAGKPAPTGIQGVHIFCVHYRLLWERACPQWRSVRRRNLECTGPIASKLTPTLDCIRPDHSINCGSELARDGGVSDAAILNVLAPSRASSHPHWTASLRTTRSTVGASLLAMAECQAPQS
jgi:hypothetical protein